jgi:hypothetical protein
MWGHITVQWELLHVNPVVNGLYFKRITITESYKLFPEFYPDYRTIRFWYFRLAVEKKIYKNINFKNKFRQHNFKFHKMCGIYCPVELLLAFEKILQSVKLVIEIWHNRFKTILEFWIVLSEPWQQWNLPCLHPDSLLIAVVPSTYKISISFWTIMRC